MDVRKYFSMKQVKKDKLFKLSLWNRRTFLPSRKGKVSTCRIDGRKTRGKDAAMIAVLALGGEVPNSN